MGEGVYLPVSKSPCVRKVRLRKLPLTRKGIADWSAGILAVGVLALGGLVVLKPALDDWDGLYRADPFGLATTTKTFKQRGDRVTGIRTTKLRASAAERVLGRSGLVAVRLSLVGLTAFLLAAVLHSAILADYRLRHRRPARPEALAAPEPASASSSGTGFPTVADIAEPSATSLAPPIAKLVATRREALGLSQRELAKRAGISHTVVSRIEQGEHTPSRKTLERLADAL
jgi:DNA-binding XRE family transcriptional regulator